MRAFLKVTLLMINLRELTCRWKNCQKIFWLCGNCYCGQTYCSDQCRIKARQQSVKSAQLKYAMSQKGLINNKQRQRRFRLGHYKKSIISSKIVTDQSSQIAVNVLFYTSTLENIVPCHDENDDTKFSTKCLCFHRLKQPEKLPIIRRCHTCGRKGQVVWRDDVFGQRLKL